MDLYKLFSEIAEKLIEENLCKISKEELISLMKDIADYQQPTLFE